MDRDQFIQQLVAALQENTALSGGASSFAAAFPASRASIDTGGSSQTPSDSEKSPGEDAALFMAQTFAHGGDRDDLAKRAHAQLQFDFPQVEEAALVALSERYKALAQQLNAKDAGEWPITASLLNGVAFLNDRTDEQSGKSEGSGLLAAAVLLLVFRRSLEAPSAAVDALLQGLRVKQAQEKPVAEEEKQVVEEEPFVETFAAQEDPDDLSEVYEGHLPVPRSEKPFARSPQDSVDGATTADKLRYLASHTFSSSFEAVSMEKWEQWGLDDELVAIMRLLVEKEPEDAEEEEETEEDKKGSAPGVLYGPRGEWSRYLYVLRDRILRFPSSSRNALWRLKELVGFLQQRHTAPVSLKAPTHRVQLPQHLVYRVLAELAISREFHQGAVQRAQQGLALAIQELLPLITQEVHQLATAASPSTAISNRKSVRTEEKNDLKAGDDDDGDDELAVVFLQLLHFMLFASPNARTTTEKLHESGMLRTLLSLLPPVTPSGADSELHAQCLDKRWFPALLRLLGECALWHAGFAGYVVRVPKFVGLLPVLREQLVAEELLLALAFQQHQVQARPATSDLPPVDIWEVFTSSSLFPEQCDSYLEAMKKLQDAVFVLDCLEKAVSALRPAVQKDLQRSLQQIYARFARSFEYPSFAAAEAARQEQQFEQQALAGKDGDDEDKEKKEEDRGQAEALQFTALRNCWVRRAVASLSPGRSASKLTSRCHEVRLGCGPRSGT